MIRGKNIICFASNWDFHPTSKHHIMRQLSEQNNIIWVNWHASRRPTAGISDLRSIWSKLSQIRQGPKRVSDTITVLTPCQLPFPASLTARRINAALVRQAIHKILKQLPPLPVQIWSFAPDIAEMVGGFNEELVLYYCVDAFGEFPGYDREMITRRERELMEQSDVVITTSPPLYDDKRQQHPNVHLIEHGVDHSHLCRAVTQNLSIPAALEKLPRPIWGFVGVIGEWVDLELVGRIARQRPDVSLVLIGPEIAPRTMSADLPNVHWLGSVDHSMLPDYLRYFDVGLIPFKPVPLTYNANPIKLYEYLAAGVPVVSNSLPAVRAIEKSVWLADDVKTIIESCEQAMRFNDSAARQHRSRIMMAESWTARLEQISNIILASKTRRTPATSEKIIVADQFVSPPNPEPVLTGKS